MSLLGREEKERILRSLEEDREFRYALMGLLGYRELLDRFARLEERQQALEERQQRLEERFAELEEHFARLEERQQRLEERFAKLEERVIKLEERFAQLEERVIKLEERFAKLEERFAQLEERFLKLEERVTRLEERQQRLEERFAKLEELVIEVRKQQQRLEERQQRLEERFNELEREVKRLGATVGALGRRFGKGFEALYREGYRDLLEKLGIEEYMINTFKYIDREGKYVPKGTSIEVDIVVRDGQLWVVEIKSTVDKNDVEWFSAKASVVEKVLGRGVDRRVILGVVIDRDAYERARELGVEVIYINLVD